jgi:putative FmdB family regulatory protein
MPIYEFYCQQCNTIYKFFSRTINTEKTPGCPECRDVKLERRMSMFSMGSGSSEDDPGDAGLAPIDESRLEKAMSALAKESDRINEDDPRQAANLMRKLSDAAGLKLGAGMEEALARLEKGEDPEKIEAEMGDLLESEDPFRLIEKQLQGKKKPKPRVDDTIYDL